jgi:hypothetical protein
VQQFHCYFGQSPPNDRVSWQNYLMRAKIVGLFGWTADALSLGPQLVARARRQSGVTTNRFA